jgi:tRNA threonylcarbamoyladenosine biosynthesis protein TsaE
MAELVRTCADESATTAAGHELAGVLDVGDIVLLVGPMGAGKTRFSQGVAKGLGVVERVTSPTFTVMRSHRADGPRGIENFHHADLYRVNSVDEVHDLALGELVEEGGVALVEWGDIAPDVFGPRVLIITFAVYDDVRVLHLSGALLAERSAQLEEWASR